MGCSCRDLPDEDVALGVTVIVEVPDGVTTRGGTGASAALPPPQPATHKSVSSAITAMFLLTAKPASGWSEEKLPFLATKTSNRDRMWTKGPSGGEFGNGNTTAPPLVVTITVNGKGFPFETCTGEGN